MTAVIISGGIDLSVGAVVVLSAMIVGMTMAAGAPIWVAAPLALIASLAVGLFNGMMIAYVGMPPFVVTLGVLSVARSLAMVISNNKMVYQFGPDHDLLLTLGGGSTLGIPHPVYVLAVLGAFTALAFRWSRWGRHLFAVGGNEHAAILTGIPVKRVKVLVYMFAALTAGITGVLEVGWLGGVTTNLGQGMELNVIAAAVIGGANLAGGVGTALGAIVGAALIEVIRNSLILLGINTFWQGTFVGSFIIIAVLFDRLRASRSAD
jgi:ribose transport system permease protein